ncbi:MAG: FGGY-family carbohydrate kinase [Clostridia bacterium]|nr:FGGY-family carbohydrate kinase [Clostridia bacterium]
MEKTIAANIAAANTCLGIEFGSTRIKAILIDDTHQPIASGSFAWENALVDGIWTYSTEDIWHGLQACYADLKAEVQSRYGVTLKRVGAMGFSAMMHGYMAFDKADEQLVPFRTWRNTITGEAAEKLTALLDFNIPQRWSIAHLYQAILNGEAHVPQVAHITTLAGYIHWQLTGEKVVGVGEASGMFPIDSAACAFDKALLARFDQIEAVKAMPWRIEDILPKVLCAGEAGGTLSARGARLLDPSGDLEAGIPLCPPEGDAGTGMVATNAVSARSGNISAGTSVFAMVVLEKPLSKVYTKIDMVTTPSGEPVAMVHSNNCTGDLDAWVGLFRETLQAFGAQPDMDTLYGTLYRAALSGEADCGGLLAYNYISGEHLTGFDEGRPLFVRTPNAAFNLQNFMRVHLYTALGALKMGMDILLKQERVSLDRITGHGGLFKVKGVGQRFMAAALNAPVSVMENAGEGGPWGMAILAAYRMNKRSGEALDDYLANRVFANSSAVTAQPDAQDAKGFEAFMARYAAGESIERAAIAALPND